MKTPLFCRLMAFLLLIISNNCLCAYFENLDIEVGGGWGKGKFDWNIATPDREIDVLSELEWENLQYWNTRLYTGLHLTPEVIITFEGNYGQLYEGHCDDSDYSLSGRKNRWSFSRSTANRGEIFDYSFGGAYDFCWSGASINADRVALRPVAGWECAAQHLRQMSPSHFIYNGNNDPFDPNDLLIHGDYTGLHSNYRGRWQGPWTGLFCNIKWTRFHLNGGFEYHWLNYLGTGHWNLRREFYDDFRQTGRGEGLKLKFSTSYDLTEIWSVGLMGTYTDYHIKGGIDRVRFYDPNNPDFPDDTILEARTRLNAVHWHAFTIVFNWQASF